MQNIAKCICAHLNQSKGLYKNEKPNFWLLISVVYFKCSSPGTQQQSREQYLILKTNFSNGQTFGCSEDGHWCPFSILSTTKTHISGSMTSMDSKPQLMVFNMFSLILWRISVQCGEKGNFIILSWKKPLPRLEWKHWHSTGLNWHCVTGNLPNRDTLQ